ncbi:beta-ketoacyl synthase N-terminal-like domain-containing protein, partial [Streptomyces sp. NPDC051218]|uniref:beta-ketoacyl synthase N-terminal-like domain-containing protein n=1 Tax=Streptomyces sp. NPDC051218 TaxID=3365645 RepID=UPI00379C556F
MGMSCRYPGGVRSPEDLWNLLDDQRDALSDFPEDRNWNRESLYSEDPERPGRTYLTRGGFIEDVAGFDAGFFGIPPREALSMEPQQRLLLEASWEALERAAITPAAIRGTSTGVFVGAEPREYGPRLWEAPESVKGYLLTGTTTSVMSGRISYLLGLHGPSITVDTSASSSLVAIHLAAQALRQGECSLALAGGVSVMATPGNFVAFSGLRALSPSGVCKPFSASADGTVWSEGVGLIVLERLSDAVRNGHSVLAVLRGSAINSDGTSDGLTAPNGRAQEAVIRRALANAGLTAADVDAVEAHGTGTRLGDPIEAQALLATYGQERPDDRPLWLGSVKSHIGHAQAAAGVAGVIKMVLALRRERLPRTLHAEERSPRVDWSSGDVRLLTEPVPWPTDGRTRRAGVSAFGISGTNAHLIVEEAPVAADAHADAHASAEPAQEPPVVGSGDVGAWLVSGRSAEGLAAQAQRLHEWVNARPELQPVDVAWSLAATRSVFEHRAVVVGGERAGLVAGLESLAGGVPAGSVVSGVARPGVRTVFAFAGQGSQWVGMGRELASCSPVFAARLAECERALSPHVPWSLSNVLAGAEGAPELVAADVVQPVLWAVMVSLAAVWEAAGVSPDAVVGHSQGEIAAATVAGMLSLEDGARVVALRSQSLKVLAGAGGMLSVSLSAAAVEERLPRWGERLSLAAVNGPAVVVVSGEPEALEELKAELEADGVRARMVAVDYASHSAQVERLEEEILSVLAEVAPRKGRVPMVSAMTGETLSGEELDAEYWYGSLRATVHYERAVRTLAGMGHQVFIEVTPHPVLLGAMNDTLEEVAQDAGPGVVPGVVCGTLRRDEGGATRMITSLAEASVHGVEVDWTAVLPLGERVELPTYAFRHERFWLDSAGSFASGAPSEVTELSTLTQPQGDAAVLPPLDAGTGVLRQLAGRPEAEQDQMILDLIQTHSAAVLGHASPQSIDPGHTFKELGFDSVTGVELRNRLSTAVASRLPSGLIFDYPTPAVLSEFLRAEAVGDTDATGMGRARPAAAGVAASDDPIAIVAMSCRLPGGVSAPEQLWDLLAEGGDAIAELPTDRGWDLSELYDPDAERAGTCYTREGGFISGAGEFDAAFFGVSPREALAMDPQQRLLLETSWEAFERAGIDPRQLRGSATGVFVGAASSGYGANAPEDLEGHLQSGIAPSVISGRVAYTLGLEGPALTVDTACSSSLVALHLAAQALRSGECSLALAGGVTVHATPSWLVWFSRQRGLAADGRCKAYSEQANGMGMAEGAGVVVLERLSDARRLGHEVLAVVSGSAVNQDGASNGLTAPNGPSQQRVIRSALAGAGL